MGICSGISTKWLFIHYFQIKLEFRSADFWGGRKTGEVGKKTLGARTRTSNKLNPHVTSGPGIEPGPHWWEASALTTVSSLLPYTGNLAVFNSVSKEIR